MDDHYASWEWVPIENMPDGCNEVEVRFEDGSTVEYCSCDYWWSLQSDKAPPTHFRFGSLAVQS